MQATKRRFDIGQHVRQLLGSYSEKKTKTKISLQEKNTKNLEYRLKVSNDYEIKISNQNISKFCEQKLNIHECNFPKFQMNRIKNG